MSEYRRVPTIEQTVEIAASPATVSDVILDTDAASRWISDLVRFDLIEGTPGEPGCVGHAHYVEDGRRYVLEDRLLEASHGEHFKSEIRGEGLTATVETHLDEIEGGTRMTIRWKGTGTKLASRLLLPFLRSRIRSRTRDDLLALRDLIENSPS